MRQRRKLGKKYALASMFSLKHYRDYKMTLPKADRRALDQVTYGDIFTSEANGIIFNSPFGRIVTISQSLRYFLQFSHLALLRFDGVPEYVRFQALLIALRVMFQYESLDFDADPRGIIPPAILRRLLRLIPAQLEFIAGHEFAHHLLGHLSEQRLQLALSEDTKAVLPHYSLSEQEELDADLCAIMRPQVDDDRRTIMLNGVLIWLAALELYQHAVEVIRPSVPWRAKSHPSARDRHSHLVRNIETKHVTAVRSISESAMSAVETFKPVLTEYLGLNIEHFETYGSMYLDAPNTSWRGPEMTDRVDYW